MDSSCFQRLQKIPHKASNNGRSLKFDDHLLRKFNIFSKLWYWIKLFRTLPWSTNENTVLMKTVAQKELDPWTKIHKENQNLTTNFCTMSNSKNKTKFFSWIKSVISQQPQ